jgi:hypothetical protein
VLVSVGGGRGGRKEMERKEKPFFWKERLKQ